MKLDLLKMQERLRAVVKNRLKIRQLENKLELLFKVLNDISKSDIQGRVNVYADIIPLFVELAARKGERRIVIMPEVEHKPNALTPEDKMKEFHEDAEKLAGLSREVFLLCKNVGLNIMVQYQEEFDMCRSHYFWEMVAYISESFVDG